MKTGKFTEIQALCAAAGNFEHSFNPTCRSIERKATRLIQKLSTADRAELYRLLDCEIIDQQILDNAR